MRNEYLAKVLYSNKLVTEAQIQENWCKINTDHDLGQVLCEAGILDSKMYTRVLDYVKTLEAKAVEVPEVQSVAPAAVEKKEVPPPVSVPQPTIKSTPSPQKPVVPKSVVPKAPAASKIEVNTFSLEGNNPFGDVVPSSVQVEVIEGLESTSMSPVSIMGMGPEPDAVANAEKETNALPDRFAVATGEGSAVSPESVNPETSLSGVLAYARNYNATDIYLQPGFLMLMRQAGKQHYFSDKLVDNNHLDSWLAEAAKGFADGYEPCVGKDFSKTLALPGVGRARLTVTWEDAAPALAIRLIPTAAVSLDKFYLPPFCLDFLSFQSGLVFIAGPSGSGRSTMLTTMGETIAANRHIFLQTIEKPIERLLQNPKGIVIQKEVGLHTHTSVSAIQEAISDGADVILFDHMDSIDELWLLLQAANAGSLVFVVSSGNNILGMMTRLLECVPESHRSALCFALADQMKGVLVQHLIPVVQGQGQILAFESMKVTSTIANLIRKGELTQIPAAISAAKNQGQSLDDSLQSLVESGYINGVEAWQRASDPRRFSAYHPEMHGKGV
ncbi:MAG: hypothetical protein AUK31_09680 [Fibrobacteres bacterium CG2_30_45_31]|nr:MAG: hypothetical protein AUK31_09680 [Fibrobacteres bacterium CG2_30_45_31]